MASSPQGPLAGALARLAGTPDHSYTVAAQLVAIARMAAERVEAVSYASITALRGKAHVTVAVSDELVLAVDEAQYADDAGPCLEALKTGTPVTVPDIAATVQWPRFHEEAPRLGLHSSVSVPLYAGRVEPIAVLNLYGRDPAAMAPLAAGICAVHEHAGEEPGRADDLPLPDDGSRELIAGYAETLVIRATIQLALGIIMQDFHCVAEDAYLSLCIRAAEADTDLAQTAATFLTRKL
jgi:hypothetical protein